jgi:MFS transporter, DHA1 family, multidrug resistance protein
MFDKARHGAHTLNALWVSTFLVSLPFGVLSFALPIYGKMLQASALQVGALFSAVAFVPVLVRPFLGRMLDRWGRKPFLLTGFCAYGVSMLLLALARSVLVLAIGRFVQGIGQAFLWLAAYAIVADIAQEKGRGRDFGAIDEATNRGALIGAIPGILAISVMEASGIRWEQVWPVLFGLYAAAAFSALGLAGRKVGETGRRTGIQPVVRRPLSLQLAALMGIVMITGASTAMVWPILVVFLNDSLGTGGMTLAIAYLPAALVGSFLPSRLGRITDRFGRKPIMALGLVIGACASALMPQLRSVVLLAILWAVDSLGYAASAPAERAFVADIAGSDTRGVSYGLYTFAYFLGAAVGPLAGGWLYDQMGRSIPFYANSVMLLLGALLVMTLLREPRKGAAPGNPAGRGASPSQRQSPPPTGFRQTQGTPAGSR